MLADEKIALARLVVYTPATLWVTPTVLAECEQIRDEARRALHFNWIRVKFGERRPADAPSVARRAALLGDFHDGTRDCMIVAEAKAIRVRIKAEYNVEDAEAGVKALFG